MSVPVPLELLLEPLLVPVETGAVKLDVLDNALLIVPIEITQGRIERIVRFGPKL
jgi:hypothetical protein